MITLSAMCLIVGIYMFFCGVFVGLLEAPIFFTCWEWSKKFTANSDKITPIHRAVIYALYVTKVKLYLFPFVTLVTTLIPSPANEHTSSSPSHGSMSVFLFFCISISTLFAAILLLGTSFLNGTIFLESRVCLSAHCNSCQFTMSALLT